MIASSLAGVVMACALMTDASDPPLLWSPSGDWIAFVAVSPEAGRALARFPLFADEEEPSPGRDPSPSYCIWAVRVEDGRALRVARQDRPLTSPAWSPDGHGLAFGRVVEDGAGGPGRWEVVIAYGEELEVVTSRPIEPGTAPDLALLSESVAWAPAGDLLAVPEPDRQAVALIDLKTGTTLRRIEGARKFSFSPVGGRMAFYRARGDRWELVVGRPDEGPESDLPIDLVSRADQPPAWLSDGQTLLYLKLGPPGADGMQARFFSYRIDAQGPREVKDVESPALPGERIDGLYLSVAGDGLDQFFVVQYSGRPVAMAYHQGSHPLDRIHPFSGLGMLGAPSVSPSGGRVAIRFDGPGPASLPGVIDLSSKQLTPLAPDDDLRAAWVVALGRAAEPPGPRRRPTRLPFAQEFGDLGPSPATYRRLSQQGARLTDELDRSGIPRALTSGPALFFSYLQGDYDAAERALGELAQRSWNPDRAERLLGLRAQLALAKGKDAEAREIIDYIRHQHRERIARVETDGSGGFSVSREQQAAPPWPEELWKMHEDRIGEKAAVRPEPNPTPPPAFPSPFDRPSPQGETPGPTLRPLDPSPRLQP